MELGLDRSWFVQYLDIVKSAFTFDFGRSWSTKQEIIEMIRQGAIPSLTLSLPAFALATIFSISISLLVAFYRGTYIDRFVVFLCVAMMSISSLALYSLWSVVFRL